MSGRRERVGASLRGPSFETALTRLLRMTLGVWQILQARNSHILNAHNVILRSRRRRRLEGWAATTITSRARPLPSHSVEARS